MGLQLPPTNKTVGSSGSVPLTFTSAEPVIWVGLLNCFTSELNADVTFTMENLPPVKFECSTYKTPDFGPDGKSTNSSTQNFLPRFPFFKVPRRHKSTDWWIAIVILIVLVAAAGGVATAYHYLYGRHQEEETRPIRS